MALINRVQDFYFLRDYGVPSGRLHAFFDESQYWSAQELESYQLNHINKLLAKAVSESPFYKKRYAGRQTVLSSISALLDMPCVTKSDVAQQSNLMMTRIQGARSYEHSTSGSTGDPLKIQISAMAEAVRQAGHQRLYAWWGLRQYDRHALIWARKATVAPPANFRPLNWIKTYARRNLIDRCLFINVFDLNRAAIAQIHRETKKYRPSYIRGYKSAILQFAELIISEKLSGEELELKLVVVTSEVLLEDERKVIEQVFQCPVANEYGSAEAGLFAFECANRQLHVFEEAVLVLRDHSGEVIVTELFNDATPLINYRNGDGLTFAEAGCPCGRTSRIIESVNGRLADNIVTESGESLSPYIIYYAVKELDDVGLGGTIKKYKVIQRGSTIQFLLVPGDSYGVNVETYLSMRLRSKIGSAIDLRFSCVEEIPREKSGKLRFFVRES